MLSPQCHSVQGFIAALQLQRPVVHEVAFRPGVSRRHRHSLCHWRARCQRGFFGFQLHFRGGHRRAVRRRGRAHLYWRFAVDSEKPLRPARQLFQGCGKADGAGSCAQLFSQQHDGGDALRGHRQDVV